jgi:hypothetical protein
MTSTIPTANGSRPAALVRTAGPDPAACNSCADRMPRLLRPQRPKDLQAPNYPMFQLQHQQLPQGCTRLSNPRPWLHHIIGFMSKPAARQVVH